VDILEEDVTTGWTGDGKLTDTSFEVLLLKSELVEVVTEPEVETVLSKL